MAESKKRSDGARSDFPSDDPLDRGHAWEISAPEEEILRKIQTLPTKSFMNARSMRSMLCSQWLCFPRQKLHQLVESPWNSAVPQMGRLECSRADSVCSLCLACGDNRRFFLACRDPELKVEREGTAPLPDEPTDRAVIALSRGAVGNAIPPAHVRADEEREKPGPDKVQACKHGRLLNKEMKKHSEGS